MNKLKLLLVLFAFLSVPVLAQDDDEEQSGKFGNTPEDSVECVKNLSLYHEFFKQGNHKDALTGWRKAIEICPQSRKSLYINGAKMYEKLIKETEDKALKDGYVDTLMWIYDQRIVHFGQEGYVLGRKGSDLLQYRTKDAEKAYQILMKSLELQKDKFEAGAMIYLFKAATVLVKYEKLPKEEMFVLYTRLSEIAENNIAKNDKYSKYYGTAKENLNKMFAPFAECPDLVKIFQPKLEQNPTDTTMMKLIIMLFDNNDCTEEEVYITAAKNLYEQSPSPKAAYNIARWYAVKDKCSEAIEYYKQVGEKSEDKELKVKAYLEAASCYKKMGQLSAVRTYAQKALGVNPNLGQAYLLIGDAYAASSKECGGNDCTKKAIYWAAVDKYTRAKSVDASVAEDANKRIATYSKYFPKKQDCFFHGITEGTSYTVGCWINEETTVRVIE